MTKKVQPRKKQEYLDQQTKLAKDLQIKNMMAVPTLEKIIVNIGSKLIMDDNALLEQLQSDIALITGQKPVITRATKSIANFKLREGMPVGIKVTLRGDRMWEFFDKLVSVVLPRVKDFRGVPSKAFDGAGNMAIGLVDQSVFPEIDTNKVMKYHPLQIVIVTTADNDEAGYKLLKMLGMPYSKPKN